MYQHSTFPAKLTSQLPAEVSFWIESSCGNQRCFLLQIDSNENLSQHAIDRAIIGEHKLHLTMENRLLTTHGKQKLADDGFMYTLEKNSRDGKRKFWRCDQRTSELCPACLHTDNSCQTVLKRMHEHCHGSDAAQVNVTRIKGDIKKRALQTLELPSQILNNAICNTDTATLARMPQKDAVRKLIQRTRNENAAVPPAPMTLQNLVIPDQYKYYEFSPGQREFFLLADVAFGEGQRILIFGRQSYSSWSDHMKKIYIDGTFSITPPLFAQVFVIMSKRGEYVFPVAYALLPSKSYETYCLLFTALKEVWPLFNPTSVSMDFETSAITAVRSAFPDAEIYGCLFHLTQNLRKHLATAGLFGRYTNEAMFALQARMIVGLAFVPLDKLEEAYEALCATLPADFGPIFDWFEGNYLGLLTPMGTRRPARFPPSMWSVHQRVWSNNDRTNNIAEAAHRRLKAEIDMCHPTIWKFLDSLRKVQKGRDLQYEEYVRGIPPREKRAKYRDCDQRILNLVNDFDNRDIIEFLRGVANNFLV